MKLSVAMPPGPDAVDCARLAESLGYDRIWFYDSAALYEDIWVTLARVAERTKINLGTAVLVPNLRHVMTTAAAIATIERLAPGRLACGFGTGATARWVLNKPALSWATTRRYVEQLHGLLHGTSWWGGEGHAELDCERFADALAWAYWPSHDNVMKPLSAADEGGQHPDPVGQR